MRQTAGPSTHARLARTTPPRPLPASHRLVGYRERRSTAEISVALIACVWPFQCGTHAHQQRKIIEAAATKRQPLLVEAGRERRVYVRTHRSNRLTRGRGTDAARRKTGRREELDPTSLTLGTTVLYTTTTTLCSSSKHSLR